MQSKLFIWEGSALFIGKLADNSVHHHHAVQYCLGINKPFELIWANNKTLAKFTLINANVPHQLDDQGAPIALALVDSSIARPHGSQEVVTIDNETWNATTPELPNSLSEAKYFVDWMNEQGNSTIPSKPKMDRRIASIIPSLNQTEKPAPTAKELADKIGLSQSRFMHLFKDSTGIAMRRYILWRRIINTITAISQGENLTSAAHFGGFSDSSHFSRIFRETFGIAPSQLFQPSRNIQLIIEKTR